MFYENNYIAHEKYCIMKKLVLLIFVSIILVPVFSQVVGGIHSKLADYYSEERWEDCAFKADRMILKDKYRNDAEVYLYLAASYNKIFLLGLVDTTLLKKVPEYANAYKFALKYAKYAQKKDRKAGFYFPENNNMLEEIAISGIYYVDHYIDEGKVAKSGSYARKIMKVHSDINIYFLHGVLSAMSGDPETANEVIDSVFTTMDNQAPSGLENTQFMMLDGFDHYAHYLMSLEEPLKDSAINITNKGLKYFPDNELLKWNLEWIENPEIETTKPKNSLKTAMLKDIAVTLPGDDSDDDDDEDYDEDE